MASNKLMKVLRDIADAGEIIQLSDKPNDYMIRLCGSVYAFAFVGDSCVSVTYREQDTIFRQNFSTSVFCRQNIFVELVESQGELVRSLTITTPHSVTYITKKGIDTTIF